jgi:peroxiredoxin
MKQLVQLRKASDQIKKLNAQVVVIQREDKLRIEGLKRTADNTKTDFLFLDDFGSKATSSYSSGAYNVYIVDSGGFLRNILTGTKTNRPTAEKVVARLGELKK